LLSAIKALSFVTLRTSLESTSPPALAAMANPLKIGATIPNFPLETSEGNFTLHEFLKKDEEWTIFFSHPADYTPVCTTEIGLCHKMAPMFKKLNCKLIGLSCDPVEQHKSWAVDILAREGCEGPLAFPLIADTHRDIVDGLGMLDPEEVTAEGIAMPARILVILQRLTVRLTILYPATTGRHFEEVLRVLTSLQMTSRAGLATPVNWEYGDRVVCTPGLKEETIKANGYTGYSICEMPSGKPYLRTINCPEFGRTRPE